MDDCLNKEDTRSIKMGASGNADTAKITSLQERKKQIQEKLDKHYKELRKLCIDEAELTGTLPTEYPFEQGEVAPTFRRRIGTSYQLNRNLLNNLNNEEEISVLEMEMHMLSNMAQAALSLANESTSNKAARKAHISDYELHLQKYKALENKLHDIKISHVSQTFATNQQKHKKKPRPEKEDSVSMNLNLSDPFAKPFRHSLRSLQYQSTTQTIVKPRPISQRVMYLVPDGLDNAQPQCARQEPTFYKLSLDGYKQYEDSSRQESLDVCVNEGHFRSYPNQAVMSRTLPHASRRSPQTHAAYNTAYSHSTLRLSSPGTSSTSSVKYYPLAVQGQLQQRQYYPETRIRSNPLQLQPHQQYEQNVMTSGGSGLGGYWKQSENGEFWCDSSSESMKDKRFGSLDRRKNKRLQKKISKNNVDPKSATLMASVPSYQEATRTLPTKSQAIATRRHENRQLVRTQSLGSVGGILDSTCPSDDSSCGSEIVNSDALLRQQQQKKPKEWYETSLDGPSLPVPYSTTSRTHSAVPSIAPEDKYVDYPTSPTTPQQTHFPPSQPVTPTTPKEIPAESKPSPRVPEANLELFNNNIPKNCTIVQQAQWKPYHEETKPFEMSDFYKYSTKYKKKPEEAQLSPSGTSSSGRSHMTQHSSGFRNLPTNSMLQSTNRNSDVNLSNHSFDRNQLSPQVADNFSAEMNAWYQKHEHQSDNNNATLV